MEAAKNALDKFHKPDVTEKISGKLSMQEFRAAAENLLRNLKAGHYAFLCFNVNQFKYINELFGYENGSKVLQGIYWVLHAAVKEEELCAHLTADRFVMLMRYGSRRELEKRLDKICGEIYRSVEFYGIHYKMDFIMGIYEYGNHTGLSIEAMIDRAVIAQKSADSCYPKCYVFYDDKMRMKQLIEKNMEDRLLPALKNHEFVVYYQPKYDLKTQKIAGCEALVRWQTDPDNLVPPGEFIPVFEANGTIIPLDRYIFDQVCSDIRKWLDRGMNVVPVSVNLSRAHLRRPTLKTEYEKIAARHQVPFNLLELELTESAVAEKPQKISAVMNKLRKSGFALSIDDFGSGYSALNILKDIPAGTAKLDRQFLIDSAKNEKGRVILKNMIQLCREIGMTVVAEGVETEAQVDLLKELRCDMAQGFYFSKPLPRDDYERFLIF